VDVTSSIEQVAGILVREDFKFDTAPDGRSYRLLFGTAGVFIHFYPWGEDGSVVIKVHSPVVQDIDPESPGGAEALNLLNVLNQNHVFVKFRLLGGTLIAEYDLLGDTLQAGELRNALMTVASAADHLDDDLADRLGGKRFDTKLEEWDLSHEEDQHPPPE
jgi:type III secretion system-like peptide-binding chaperone